MQMNRRTFFGGLSAALFLEPLRSPSRAQQLVAQARAQVGVTLGYDPHYVRLPYPGGDVPRSTGVCADVIVRAYRDALRLDLQQLVHEDMARAFAAYPHTWGSVQPDPNIDHRRVLNLEAFWRRASAELFVAPGALPGDAFPGPLQPGDLVTWRLDARLPHVAIITEGGGTPRVVHNIGGGAQELELAAFRSHRAHGHYRWALG